MKYNDSERYTLLKNYVSSIDKGMLSPLTGFDKYEEYYDKVQNELIGLIDASGIVIKSQSKHFLERVFGTKNDPTHDDIARSGVRFEDIKDAILSDKMPVYSSKNDTFVFTNSKCQVSISISGNLVQTNPKGAKK